MKGIAASGGIAIGKAFVLTREDIRVSQEKISHEAVPTEQKKLATAIEKTRRQLLLLKEKTQAQLSEKEAGVFDAHIMFLDDPEYIGGAREAIEQELIGAAYAVKSVTDAFVNEFRGIEDAYFKERAADVADVGERIMRNILGLSGTDLSALEPGSIVVAHDLTPSDTALLDKNKVLGFAADVGGKTSHAAIMARSLMIPAVLGLTDITQKVRTGDSIIIDGSTGIVIHEPDLAAIEEYRDKKEAYEKELAELFTLKDAEAITKDGCRVELFANIGTTADVDGALKYGAQGIGLFRTEFLYMDAKEMPGEDIQFEAYKQVLEKMQGRPVIIRTLDIGGDKKLPYLPTDDEMNPFLGLRAIRLCFKEIEMFKTQLRAILRASVFGKALIMFPMIATVTEVRQAKAILNECKQELSEKGIAFDPDVKAGIMVEVPSAAVSADTIAKEVDFFSIGTNDLCQYTLAVDRMNGNVSYLYDHFDPAVLRLIKMVIDASHNEGIFTGMCGEMAGDERAAALLLGLGLDEFSMSAASVLRVKKAVRNTAMQQAKQLAKEALTLESAEEVKALIKAGMEAQYGTAND
ncbi:MAG: phosphoenolpyruvate--protein phosphotransferase [Bacillota bacterium]